MPTPSSADAFAQASDLLARFREDPANFTKIDDAARRVAAAFAQGRKLLACGNGGSACEAMHLCEELTGRFRTNRPALPAIACIDPGHLTCAANDFGYDHVFSRWVEALGQPGDILVLFSTSGNSPNILQALAAAKQRNLTTLALLGGTGGALAGHCTLEWIVPASRSDRVQEIHQIIMHALIEAIERAVFPDLA